MTSSKIKTVILKKNLYYYLNRPAPHLVSKHILICLLSLGFFILMSYPSTKVLSEPEVKPYDKQLLRLSELLGGLHYLRELCSANEGQRWRQYMQSILDTETSNLARKARLTRSFNQGYRNYSRTFSSCTPSAQATIDRFLAESIEISGALALRAP